MRFENGTLATVSTGCYVKDGAAYDSKIIFSAADARGELSILSKFDVYEPVKQSEDRAENGFVIQNDGAVRPSRMDSSAMQKKGMPAFSATGHLLTRFSPEMAPRSALRMRMRSKRWNL